jgi:hypothetical protein
MEMSFAQTDDLVPLLPGSYISNQRQHFLARSQTVNDMRTGLSPSSAAPAVPPIQGAMDADQRKGASIPIKSGTPS